MFLPPFPRFNERSAYALLTILYIAFFFLISPRGEFPLNDDWAHTLSVYVRTHAGIFQYPSWLSATLHFPIAYGTLLSSVFGFSFTLLRVSNLIFAFLTIILYYALLRRLHHSPVVSVFIALLFWLNPIFFNLSYTFMGDVPALFLFVASLHFFKTGMDQKRTMYLLAGAVVQAVGFFVRQTSIIFLGIISLYLLIKKEISVRQWLSSFVLPVAGMLVVYGVLWRMGAVPGKIGARFLPEGWSYITQIIFNSWHLGLLVSFFALPVTIAVLMRRTITSWWAPLLLILAAAGGVIVSRIDAWGFPGLGNIINLYGLGPNRSVMQGEIQSWGPPWVYSVATGLFSAGLAGLIMLCRIVRRQLLMDGLKRVLLLYGAVYIFMLLPIRTFDRYAVGLLPVIALLLAEVLRRFSWSKGAFIAVLAVFVAYALVGTHNYLAWNDARWQLGRRLLATGTPVEQIEGGYEWNGWFLYLKTRQSPLGSFTPEWAPWYVKELSPGHGMEYIIAFSPLGGYRVVDIQKVDSVGYDQKKFIYLNRIMPGSLK